MSLSGLSSLLKNPTSDGRRFMSALEEIDGVKLTLGFGDATYPNGMTVAEVALMNEYGTSTIPPRPFIKQAYEGGKTKIIELANNVCQKIGACTSPGTALTDMAQKLEEIFREEIDKGDFTPNAESTVMQKGVDSPLVDTGLMRDSIRVEIER